MSGFEPGPGASDWQPNRTGGGEPPAPRASLRRYAWLSIGAALATMALKGAAWWLTGSVGLLSDALESLVNLAGALVMLITLAIAARPEDDDHPHGQTKAEYFASGLEGLLILLAAVSIAIAALPRLIEPQPLGQVPLGVAVSAMAAVVNLAAARFLLKAGRTHRSINIEGHAQHLMTDVWTSAGVIASVVAVAGTGFLRLDPLIALVVAANIVSTGLQLLRRSAAGLMDSALPAPERAAVLEVLARYRAQGIEFHALRTRQAGARSFVSVHVLVPGAWSVQRGHDLAERIEREIREALPGAHVITHLEPIEDPVSHSDRELDRRP